MPIHGEICEYSRWLTTFSRETAFSENDSFQLDLTSLTPYLSTRIPESRAVLKLKGLLWPTDMFHLKLAAL